MLGFVKIVNESIYTNREEKIREFIVNYILEEDDEDKIEDLVDSCSTFKDTKGNKFSMIRKALGAKKIMDSDKADIITIVDGFEDLE